LDLSSSLDDASDSLRKLFNESLMALGFVLPTKESI
jgi:hypothetical protein